MAGTTLAYDRAGSGPPVLPLHGWPGDRSDRAAVGELLAADVIRPDLLGTPLTVLWPEFDPLCPRAWSDRLGEWFGAAELRPLDGVGHFSPVEAPQACAAALTEVLP